MRSALLATPAYRGMVTCEQRMGALLLQQDMLSVNSPVRLVSWADGKDFFITARNVLLASALESTADFLVWLDADCAPAYTEPSTLYDFFNEAARTQGILGARAVRKGGGFNVRGDDYDDARPHSVVSIGLDFTVYNLRWFRGAFARCKREHDGDGMVGRCPARPHGDSVLPHFFEWWGGMGEDYRACEWVKMHDGEVRLDPRMPTWHDGKVWTGLAKSKVVLQ